jgi:hypothetical protein
MNFANMQKAAQSRYSVSSIPQLTEVCSDSSSSDDEDNKNKMKKQRVTKSVTEGQEKVLVALLKKHGPRVSVGWRGRVEEGLGGRS